MLRRWLFTTKICVLRKQLANNRILLFVNDLYFSATVQFTCSATTIFHEVNFCPVRNTELVASLNFASRSETSDNCQGVTPNENYRFSCYSLLRKVRIWIFI